MPSAGQQDDRNFPNARPESAQLRAALAAAAVNCPGTIAAMEMDPTAKVGCGYDLKQAGWCDSSTLYFTSVQDGAAVPVKYPATGDVKLSGYMTGDDLLRVKAAVVDAPLGNGNVVMLGFNALYGAQATSTYMAMWNAVFEGGR